MKRISLWPLLLIGSVAASLAQSVIKNDPAQLKGAWKVDLLPTPSAPVAYQNFEVRG